MSGVQGVSTGRLNSLLGHVTHRGYDDFVDPKNQGITYPTGNPVLLITGDPLFYTNLLATLDMFRLNSASLTFGTTDEGNQFRRRQNLHEPNSPLNALAKIRCLATAGNRIFVKSKQWLSIIS
jgi:hypothetical protein